MMLATLNSINEKVQVTQLRNGAFPARFVWRGYEHEVRRVEACWTERRRDWFGAIQRHGYRVWVGEQVYDLYQDIDSQQWVLERQLN